MDFVATADDGSEIRFTDKKRWQWLWGLTLVLVPLASIGAFMVWPSAPVWLLFPLLFFYGFVPLADAIVGGDTNNPPEAVVPSMSKDGFYEILVYCLIPGHYVLFIAAIWAIVALSPPLWASAGLVFGVALINGNTINIGHELGHKTDKRNRFFAKLALGLSGYGHFTMEHNRGHHVMVATPEDCASARLGESLYAFALRELPTTLVRGWRHEARRLRANGLPIIHWRNDILQVYALSLALTALLVAWLGWIALPFILAHHFLNWCALTLANYIEHYGLLRKKLPNGKYEPCAPHHSWNSNHHVSNLMLLHLQRHSDHHANPMRPYQALRDFDNVPSLPSGYPGCILLAGIPPLWFRVMDPKVLEWGEGDLANINVCPKNAHKFGSLAAAVSPQSVG